MTRNGKIARLPREIREQLNRRLADGEPGTSLLKWLNALPETRRVLDAGFSGREINDQNMTEWKQGGFREWEARQETLAQARELAADSKEISEAAEGSLADHLAMVLVSRYAGLMSGWDGEGNDEFRRKLRALRSLSQDIVELRRGDHSAARLKLEQEQLKEKQEWSEEELVSHFLRWATNSKVREQICEECLSPEEKERQMREIFGLAPKERNADATDGKVEDVAEPVPTAESK
jgi:hypothetical protein